MAQDTEVKKKSAREQRQSIGTMLRRSREKRGLSRQDVHQRTKIHPRVIESLEEGRLDDALGSTYLKAFLIDYARFLQLDPSGMADTYFLPPEEDDREDGEADKEIPAVEPMVPPGKITRHVFQGAVVILVCAAWIFILFLAVQKAIRHYRRRPAAVATEPSSAAGREGPSASSGNNAPAYSPEATDTFTLSVSTARDVWLKVSIDGTVAFHGTLPENARETWQGRDEIVLSEIGRPEALTLSVNGRTVEPSGRTLGKRIRITPEGLSSYGGR